MTILGIDPGPTIAESCFAWLDKDGNPHSAMGDLVGVAALRATHVIIERPQFIPMSKSKVRFDGMLSAAETFGVLACWFRSQRNCQIYGVPRLDLLRLNSWTPQKGGNGDQYVASRLRLLGYKTGKGTALNSTHARAALLCALLNVHHPDNQRYIWTP